LADATLVAELADGFAEGRLRAVAPGHCVPHAANRGRQKPGIISLEVYL
jgi:hypothetical protein